ncbi:helix-turn-helix domain-containing protein [Myroides marinus]|uniref:helix-turn-helix domain-containing protein n=1 Tax=Myroides marinus TaxID=703342 RepID=UPI002578942F|nr:helix-turn-helix transcriptional regulator [Myroides marinus]MDM1370811.1 helix-turn-helix transcriptional regulator [Myroides marinus]
MEVYTLYDFVIVIAITALFVVGGINLSLIHRLRKINNGTFKVKEQFNIIIIIIIYCVVHVLSLFLQAKDSYIHITFSFIFLIWPNIYFIYLESENLNFNLNRYYVALYGSYVMSIVMLIAFFIFDFYDISPFPLKFVLWSSLLLVIVYYLYLFIKSKLFDIVYNNKAWLFLVGLLVVIVVLLLSSIIESIMTQISYIFFLVLFLGFCIMMNHHLISKLASLTNYSSAVVGFTKKKETKFNKPSFDQELLLSIGSSLEKLPLEYFYNSCLDLNKLADCLKITAPELSYFFSNQLNTNFNQYINNIRLAKAKELLEKKQYQDVSVKDIGTEVGFSSNSSFYRTFKEKYNIAPSEYRKERR